MFPNQLQKNHSTRNIFDQSADQSEVNSVVSNKDIELFEKYSSSNQIHEQDLSAPQNTNQYYYQQQQQQSEQQSSQQQIIPLELKEKVYIQNASKYIKATTCFIQIFFSIKESIDQSIEQFTPQIAIKFLRTTFNISFLAIQNDNLDETNDLEAIIRYKYNGIIKFSGQYHGLPIKQIELKNNLPIIIELTQLGAVDFNQKKKQIFEKEKNNWTIYQLEIFNYEGKQKENKLQTIIEKANGNDQIMAEQLATHFPYMVLTKQIGCVISNLKQYDSIRNHNEEENQWYFPEHLEKYPIIKKWFEDSCLKPSGVRKRGLLLYSPIRGVGKTLGVISMVCKIDQKGYIEERNQHKYIHCKGNFTQDQFKYLHKAQLIIIDDMFIDYNKQIELFKSLLAAEPQTTIRDAYLNITLPKSLPCVILTNDPYQLAFFSTHPMFQGQVDIQIIEQYMGPEGTQPQQLKQIIKTNDTNINSILQGANEYFQIINNPEKKKNCQEQINFNLPLIDSLKTFIINKQKNDSITLNTEEQQEEIYQQQLKQLQNKQQKQQKQQKTLKKQSIIDKYVNAETNKKNLNEKNKLNNNKQDDIYFSDDNSDNSNKVNKKIKLN